MKYTREVGAVCMAALAVSLGEFAAADVLYDNGPLVTNPGAGAGGADVSIVQTSLGLLQNGFEGRIVDDFTVSSPEGWTIDTVTFYAYQLGSTTTSTITAVNLRIWDGPPAEDGSNVVWGDTTTNVLQSTAWSGIYRANEAASQSTDRPVMANVVAVGTELAQGTYWLDWGSEGSLQPGPLSPPITVLGATTTGNGLRSLDGGASYFEAVDFISGTAQGFPFVIDGDGPDISCGGDTNGSGLVDVTDLINVINSWGGDGQGPGFDADLNGDGTVDVTDLVMVITGWGPCPIAALTRACCAEDGGMCMDLTELDCATSGGVIQPAATTCADTVCQDQTGACCLGGGACEELVRSACLAAGGTLQGEGTSCAGLCEPAFNDQCEDAFSLNLSGGAVTVGGTTINATGDPEAFECPETNTVDAPGNWYEVNGTGEVIEASLCVGTDYDAKLHVYCGTDCNDLQCVTGDDDGCEYTAGPAVVQWCSEPGQTYLILVSGWNVATGNYQLVVTPGRECGEPTPCQP